MSVMGKIGSRAAESGRSVAGWVEDRTGAISGLALPEPPGGEAGCLDVRVGHHSPMEHRRDATGPPSMVRCLAPGGCPAPTWRPRCWLPRTTPPWSGMRSRSRPESAMDLKAQRGRMADMMPTLRVRGRARVGPSRKARYGPDALFHWTTANQTVDGAKARTPTDLDERNRS